jgi:FAD/FMN-containing dehydrogenase
MAPAPGAEPVAADPALARLVDQVRTARAVRGRLRIRGGDTKAWHGHAPHGEPLDTRALAGISSYEPTELVVTARAGTPLAELEAALAERGQCLAFEPPRFAAPAAADPARADGPRVETAGGAAGGAAGGTVGGMVAAGLAGPARMAAGGVRDHLLGATLLDGRGEVLSFGGQVMKNVAGYDLSRLLAGSLGALGVICEVSLKVLPQPAARATLRFEWDQARALRQLNEWAGRPLPIHASAWWNGLLVLRLAGAQAAVHAAAQSLGGEAVEPALADAFWSGLRDQNDEFFATAARAVADGAVLWRLALPPTVPPLALAGEPLVEWGGAQRWLVSRAGEAEVRAAAAAAGGHATRWRGGVRDAGVFTPLAGAQLRIQRALRRAFDPDGIFDAARLDPALEAAAAS